MMKIEIWSDYVCPFCYIGERKLSIALKQTGLEKEVEIVFNSFELNPDAQKEYSEGIHQLIAKKYNMSLASAIATNENIVKAAKNVGLEFNFEHLKPTNTFDAHRLSHYAKAKDKLPEYTEAVMASYFTKSLNISDTGVLVAIAEDIGLNRAAALEIVKTSHYAKEVRDDEANAFNRGIHGVPYFLFDGQVAISGAQPVDEFVKVLHQINKQE